MSLIALIIQVVCAILAAGSALIMAYCWLLAIVALTRKKQIVSSSGGGRHSFLVLIPAHNEEKKLAQTLLSLKRLDYPQERHRIVVVADNCSDDTVRVAVENGAEYLERIDPQNKGKGQALSWAFEHMSKTDHDAVLVLDADCEIDSHSLMVFDRYLCEGWRVLQAKYVALNPDSSPMSYAVAVGNLIENDLFYAPKSRLGLAVFLRGTGFVLKREILRSLPWRSYSITEDMEYSITLIRNRIPIKFVPEVKVYSEFPVTPTQLAVQRNRWAKGAADFSKKNAFSLFWEGLKYKNLQLLDGAWTLFALSKPLILVLYFVVLLLSVLCVFLAPGGASIILLVVGLILSASILVYIGLGVSKLGFNSHRVVLLLETPLVVLKLIAFVFGGLFSKQRQSWSRTPR